MGSPFCVVGMSAPKMNERAGEGEKAGEEEKSPPIIPVLWQGRVISKPSAVKYFVSV